ncbi:MAG: TIGR03986 family CRISPR-associated RAMP protein [Nocardiopsaceae bacterium]|nr:TIGR03986 family CRISPR-associated RAMP protein [Nocardiopsaceae bacterium]
MAEFVNPYTFVPHVPVPERGAPAGHAVMGAGRFSGVLEVRLTAKTPLLIGGFTEKQADGSEKTVLPRRKDPAGTVIVPGSGLAGAVRSLHEALVGGCMRVLDLNRAPVHRHPADTTETERLSLAIVTEVKEGRATEVALCDRWRWVPEGLLPRSEGDPLLSGDQLQYVTASGKPGDFPSNAVTGPKSRRVVHGMDDKHSDGIRPGSIVRRRRMGPVTEKCKVVLVTGTDARDPKRPTAFFVVGDVGPDSERWTVPKETWELYERTVEDADDLRPAVLKDVGFKENEKPTWTDGMEPEYADVWWPPRQEQDQGQGHDGGGGEQQRLVGKRLYHRKYLHAGQPVWVDVFKGELTEIRLSLLWRYEAPGTVGDRVGEAKGCTDPLKLCWSCRIFGAADTEGRDDNDLAVQNSYRGHVRFDDLRAQGDVQPVQWNLAPLASPKPSAGQFYLDNRQRGKLADQNTRPMATWGSDADKPGPRPIRGRKFYWRTKTEADPDSAKPQRGKKRPHQSEALSSKVELIPAGTVFKGRITFDNLSAEDYGSLLAALNPCKIGTPGEGGWEDCVLSVGGGKPFGFGAVEIEVEKVRVQGARARYLGEPETVSIPDPDAAVRAFREAVQVEARANWPALRHALSFGFVDDEDVWYPPGGGTRGDEDYDKSFEFFALTNGLRYSESHGNHELMPLPDAAKGKAAQKMDSPAGREPRRERPGGRQGER